jgi:hypothetical protein
MLRLFIFEPSESFDNLAESDWVLRIIGAASFGVKNNKSIYRSTQQKRPARRKDRRTRR